MEKSLSLFLGSTLWLLAAAGYTKKDKKLLNMMNVDTNHSVLRTPIGGILILGSQLGLRNARRILLGSGIIYLLIGLAGSRDRRAGGMLPSGLTVFDLIYHYTVGTLLVWLGARSGRMMKPR